MGASAATHGAFSSTPPMAEKCGSTLGGYVAAALVFVPAFLLYVARARARTVLIYGLVTAALLVLAPILLPVELPLGALMTR
jgi:putative tricarboxylic transport membrane protein